jgi:hypothetical protein
MSQPEVLTSVQTLPSLPEKAVDDVQIDGNHYMKMGIEPWEIAERSDLDYFEMNPIKYIMRWRKKDGLIDLDKAIHYIQKIKALAESGHYGKEFAREGA